VVERATYFITNQTLRAFAPVEENPRKDPSTPPRGKGEESYHYDEACRLLATSTDTGDARTEYIYLGLEKVAMLVDDTMINIPPVSANTQKRPQKISPLRLMPYSMIPMAITTP
jgi:hypothetical protein